MQFLGFHLAGPGLSQGIDAPKLSFCALESTEMSWEINSFIADGVRGLDLVKYCYLWS